MYGEQKAKFRRGFILPLTIRNAGSQRGAKELMSNDAPLDGWQAGNVAKDTFERDRDLANNGDYLDWVNLL